MARSGPRATIIGPWRASDIADGASTELRDGHKVESLPAGKRHGESNMLGGRVLGSDPAVRERGLHVGVDVGIAFNDDRNLRAPDIAVGLEDAEPGWARALPPLAVEYADRGTDHDELRRKIAELLAAGTRLVWVVRLTGPLRVEVHAADQPMHVVDADGELTAPGLLRNPVPVRALVDAAAADAATLRNLLQLQGYDSLDDLRSKVRDLALCQGTALALLTFLEARGLPLTADEVAAIERCTDRDPLQRWLLRAPHVSAALELFDP